MRINDLKIGTRLRIGFLAVLGFVLLLCVICVGSMKTLSGLTTKLYRHPYAVTAAILHVEAEIIRMHRGMKDVALSKTPGGIDKALKVVGEAEKRVFEHLEVIFERFLGDKKDVEALKKLVVDWKPIRDEVASLMREGDRAAAGAITREKGARHVKALDEAIQGFEVFAAGKAADFYRGAEKARGAALKKLYLVIFVTLGAGALISLLLSRSITAPIGTAVAVAEKMAGGDLSGKIEAGRKDEVGLLLSAMDTMAKNLGTIILELQSGSETLVDPSTGLTRISGRMADNAEGVSGKSGTVSVASEEMSANMNSVAAAMEQAGTNVTFVASAVEAMSATTREIASNIMQASEGINEVTENVSQTSQVAGDVAREIVDVNGAAGQMTERSSDVSESARVLSELSGTLRELTARFSV